MAPKLRGSGGFRAFPSDRLSSLQKGWGTLFRDTTSVTTLADGGAS
jgi:hypothetical protein